MSPVCKPSTIESKHSSRSQLSSQNSWPCCSRCIDQSRVCVISVPIGAFSKQWIAQSVTAYSVPWEKQPSGLRQTRLLLLRICCAIQNASVPESSELCICFSNHGTAAGKTLKRLPSGNIVDLGLAKGAALRHDTHRVRGGVFRVAALAHDVRKDLTEEGEDVLVDLLELE